MPLKLVPAAPWQEPELDDPRHLSQGAANRKWSAPASRYSHAVARETWSRVDRLPAIGVRKKA
jgi:hypothetical protein